MIQVQYNGETFYFVNDTPNFPRGFTTSFSLAMDVQTSLTKHEARRPYCASLRAAIRFTSIVSDEALRVLFAQLRGLNTQRVVVPFWPALSTVATIDQSNCQGGLYSVWKADWSQVALYPSGGPLPAWAQNGDLCCPVCVGFIKQNQPKMMSPTVAQWAVDFTESSPAAWALTFSGAPALVDGPEPEGYAAAPKLFPFEHNFKEDTESLSVSVDRKSVGFSREQSVTFYPHEVYSGGSAKYVLHGTQPFGLLSWLASSGAPGDSFWARSGFVASALINDAHIGDDHVVIDTEGLRQGDWLAVNLNGWKFFQVNVVVDATHAILTAALTFNVAAGLPLYRLSLARLDKPTVELTWLSMDLITATLAWSEVRPEAALPAGETLGTTIGRLSQRVAFFDFFRDLRNGTVQHWRFTSYERDLTWGGYAWSSGTVTCGDITQGLNMEEDTCEIEGFIFPGNPLCDEIALASEAPLQVAITFGDYTGDVGDVVQLATSELVFQGFVGEPERSGNSITARCKLGPSLFETMAPRWVRGIQCNNIGGCNPDGSYLISVGCGLLKANWKFTATVAGPVSSLYPFALHVAGLARAVGAAPTFFADWFAGGWVEWGAGANLQRRSIIHSTTPAAGAMTLTLHRYFSAIPVVGDALTIYPGCDGVYATCKAYDAAANPLGKFGNQLNFGGEPFTPATNPSTTGLPQLGIQGGKK